MPFSLLLPLKMFFSFSLSPRLPGRGTPAFVSECTLSLSFPLLFSLSLIHGAQRLKGEGEGEVFHLDKERYGEDLPIKVPGNTERGMKRKKNK